MSAANMFCKAYVQGDWMCREGSDSLFKTRDYREFLHTLKINGIQNTATWHVDPPLNVAARDVLRNFRQICEADVVITRLHDPNPPRCHWGSIALIAYAIGMGKPCYVIADESNVAHNSHIMKHPMVTHFTNEIDMLEKIKLNRG